MFKLVKAAIRSHIIFEIFVWEFQKGMSVATMLGLSQVFQL